MILLLRYHIVPLAIQLCILISMSNAANAQPHWRVMNAKLPAAGFVQFVNAEYGFLVCDKDPSGNAAIYRTVDSGKTWVKTGYGAPPVRGLTFYSPSRIYAMKALFGYQEQNALQIESLDSGMTWTTITSPVLYSALGYLFGIGGQRSTDQGVTWENNNSDYHFWQPNDGMHTAGNRDSLVMTGPCSAYLTTYSTNLGTTWAVAGTRFSRSCAFIPHTRIAFASSLLDTFTIDRSVDGGKSWNKSFASWWYPLFWDSLYADGCVAYCNSNQGLVRTTNQGALWQTIPSPTGDSILSVVGDGAVVFATVGTKLYVTTDGGDGTLSARSKQNMSIVRGRDTLTVNAGESVSTSFRFMYAGCSALRISQLLVEGFDSAHCKISLPSSLLSSAPDSIGITFTPLCPDIYHVTLTVRLQHDDWSNEDTTFALTLVVKGPPTRITVGPTHSISFAQQELCKAYTATDSIFITAKTCQAKVDSIRFYPSDSNSDLWALPYDRLTVQPDAKPNLIAISFLPTHRGVQQATLVIFQQGKNDTVSIMASAIGDSHPIAFAYDTITRSISDSVTATMRIENIACRRMRVDSVLPPYGVAIPDVNGAAQFPLTIAAGGASPIALRCSPVSLNGGALPLLLWLTFFDDPDTVFFDASAYIPIRNTQSVPDFGSPTLRRSTLSIHPMPSRDLLKVDLDGSLASTATFELVDVLGATRLHGEISTQHTEVDVRRVPAGSYVLRVMNGGAIESKHVVIER